MVDAKVPAAADAQVVAFRNQVEDTRVGSVAVHQVGSAVGGMVVNDNQVEVEPGLLFQHRADGILDGADPVTYGDDDRGFDREPLGIEVDAAVEGR